MFNSASNVVWDQLVLGKFADMRKAGLKNPLMDQIAKEFAGGG